MAKSLVLFSGGIDSAVVLHSLKDVHNIEAFSIEYGQRHITEIEYAKKTCAELNIPHTIFNLGKFPASSSITSESPIPCSSDEQGSTVVPNRNMVFVSLAVAYAKSNNFDYVYVGCNADDSEVYADCRHDYLFALRQAVLLSTSTVELRFPLIGMSKKEVVEYGRRLGVNFANTWSCYIGGKQPCNSCTPCQQRKDYLGE